MGFLIFACYFYYLPTKNMYMGRGDKRTKKGKIALGTFGVTRPAKNAKPADKKPAASKGAKA